jgi:RecA-family ATPase
MALEGLACTRQASHPGRATGRRQVSIALKIAAAISASGNLPCGSKAKRGTVIIWSGEDDAADILILRLEASGADMNRVHIVRAVKDSKGKRPFDPSKDVPGLSAAIKSIGGAALIIIDPIVMAIAKDSHKNAETRRDLQPIVDLAAALKAALLGVTHFTKGTEGRSPIDRVTGSLAFGALARVVMVAAKKQDEDDKPGVRLSWRTIARASWMPWSTRRRMATPQPCVFASRGLSPFARAGLSYSICRQSRRRLMWLTRSGQ